jgi:transposase
METGPKQPGGTVVAEYIGLDVSMKETAVSIRCDGKRIWRGKCASDPKIIAQLVRKRAPAVERVVFETGPLSVWFWHALTAEGLPAICIDARHAAKALDMAPNKTDANDADGLFVLTPALVAARTRLVRGLMKTFGLVVPAGRGSVFENNVRNLLADEAALPRIILPLLESWRSLRQRASELSRHLIGEARRSEACQILMSIPGIGSITATSFVAALEDSANFKKPRSVGAWLGLTTRRYQSGEVDYDGHISRRGDKHLRGLLYEAAVTVLTRSQTDSGLRAWGLKLRERIGFKRAAVAVARKLAVIMHALLKSGELFDPAAGAAA